MLPISTRKSSRFMKNSVEHDQEYDPRDEADDHDRIDTRPGRVRGHGSPVASSAASGACDWPA